MGVVKAMAPVALCLLGVMFLVGMADMSPLSGCGGPRRMEVQEQLVWVRRTLVHMAPLAAGILFWAGKMDDDLSAIGWECELLLHALFILGLSLSCSSSFLALSALVLELELSCDRVVNYCIAVALVGVHLVAGWAVRGRLRALKAR